MKKIWIACTMAFVAMQMICGCVDGVDNSSAMQTEFDPMVREDVSFAMGVNLDKDQAFKVVDSYAKRILPLLKDSPENVQEIQENIEEYKKDLFKNASPDVRKFMEASGLREADFRWAVISVEGRLADIFNKGKRTVGGVSLAFAVDADIERVIATIKKINEKNGNGDEASFDEMEIAGERVWRIVPKIKHLIRTFEEADADPYVTSLDGRLMLLALSRKTLENQIRLYRKCKGKGDVLGDFAAAEGDFSHLCIVGIGETIRKNVKDEDMHGLSTFLPNGPEIVKGLKKFNADVKVYPDGTARQTISLEAASSEDAEQIQTYLLGLLTVAKLGISRNPNVPKEVKQYFSALKIEHSANKVEMKNVDFLPIMAGVIFPAISSAMLSANTSAMTIMGRNIFVGIIQANVYRESCGLTAIWPRTYTESGANTNDISGKAYQTAKEYFADLFDIAKYGTDDWTPYVDIEPRHLGKEAVVDGSINIDGIEWCIAANVTDYLPDCVPVLVSANFNPELFLRKWDGVTNGSKLLPIGPDSGAAKSIFGDKAVVVVYKGGAAKVIKKNQLNYNTIYMGQDFDTANLPHPLVYLMPNGLAEPTGGK